MKPEKKASNIIKVTNNSYLLNNFRSLAGVPNLKVIEQKKKL